MLSIWAVPDTLVPSASAASCPDVQVVFARGTGEPPGVGPTGQAFVDSLRSRVGGRSVDVYPVNYPASDDWATSGLDGIRDAGAHVVSTAGSCPQTKMVLGGYSQGAAVMGFVTSAAVPEDVRAMNFLGQPPVVIGPAYQAKTIKVCAPEDPVCSDGLNFAAHDTYADDASVVDKGAAFAASRLGAGPANSAPPQSFGTQPQPPAEPAPAPPPPAEGDQAPAA
nr:cutinase family protein [Mycobacterium noviomagense]